MVVVKVHETFDFPEIESVTIFLFLLKGFQKNGGLDLNLLSGDLFSGKVSGRLPNKKGRRTGWSQAQPEFAKIKVEQKTVSLVLQIL